MSRYDGLEMFLNTVAGYLYETVVAACFLVYTLVNLHIHGVN